MTLADQCVKRACFLNIAKPGAIAPTPASRQGPWFPPVVGGNSIICYATCLAVSFDDHLNSVPSIHIRCRMTASFRATAIPVRSLAECCNLWIETHKSAWKGDGRGGSQMLNAKLLLFTHGKALKLTRTARPLEPI